jgi:PAS domain S-box-containing protein
VSEIPSERRCARNSIALTGIDQVLRETDVPTVVVDHQGLITQVNPRFEEVFGWQGSEIVGRPLATIIPRSLRDAHHLGFARFLMTGTPTLLGRPVTLPALAKDGRIFDAEHVIVAEERQGRWMFAATIRPLRPTPGADGQR